MKTSYAFAMAGVGLILSIFALGAEPAAPLPEPPPEPRPLNPALPTVFIAGDSTAARNNGDPIQGWGVPFADYFDLAKVNVSNQARGGRSSRTFITEGHWDRLLAQVKAGDIVLIQFGHNDGGALNDEPPPPLRARGSIPGLGEETKEIDNVVTKKHETVHAFGWYVGKMIADVKERKAVPVILSLTVRNIWRDGRVERGAGRYREWDRELAATAGCQFVDVTRILADEYQALGEAKVGEFFPKDHTHTNPAGANFTAAGVVAGLKGIHGGPFSPWLSPKGAAEPEDHLGWLNLPEPARADLPTLLFVGDSTVRNGRGDGEGGQWGWGDFVGEWFDPTKINVVNRAIGGLSSRTFTTQGHWERALNLLKPGDWVVLQFGHNDAGALNDNSRARGTIPGKGDEAQEIDNLLTHQRETVHSYGWYIRQYVREARAHGLHAVVCTLIPRKTWKDGHIVRAADGYAGWARQVAAEESVPVIDLNELVAARYDQLGVAEVEKMFADPHTHTSLAGAKLNASIVVAGLRALPGDPFAAYVSNPPPITSAP